MDYLSIPIELCKFALSEHKVNQVRLYIFLKSKCSGHIKLPKERIKAFCEELGYKTPKTFKSNLKWLLRKKWITLNNKSGNYRVKGFLAIANKLKFGSVKGAIFEPMEFSKFKGFLSASVITYHMKIKSRTDKKKRSEYKIGCSRKYRSNQPAFFTLPHTYLSKILDITKSCARKYRLEAINDQFLTSKHKYRNLKVPAEQINQYSRFSSVKVNKIRQYQNKLFFQRNDQIKSIIILRTKTNFKKGLKHKWKKSTPLK